MRINITYDNGLSEIAERISENISAVVEAGAEAVCERAKSVCPVDTGALRDSISTQCSGNRADITADTDYAAYVEFGTSKMAPQPYLVPSLIADSDLVIEAMAEAVSNI